MGRAICTVCAEVFFAEMPPERDRNVVEAFGVIR